MSLLCLIYVSRLKRETAVTSKDNLVIVFEILTIHLRIVQEAASRSKDSQSTVTFGSNNSGFQAGTIHGGISGLSFGRK